MVLPVTSRDCPAPGLTLDDFVPDAPKSPGDPLRGTGKEMSSGLIDGVTATPLVGNADDRGALFELLTTRDGPIEPIVHVYQVAHPDVVICAVSLRK